MYFRNYWLWKTSTDHPVKSAVSEHTLRDDMWKCPKNFPNLHEITFFMSFHHFERGWFGKCLRDYSLKSEGCFLTYWLQMASTLFKSGRICHSQCKCNYLKNEKLLLNFLLHFWNLHQILNILWKKVMVIFNAFPKL